LSNRTEPLKSKSLNNHKKPNPKAVKAKTSYSLGKNLPLKNSIKNTLETLKTTSKPLKKPHKRKINALCLKMVRVS
jgi:hypothetical protein